MLHLIPAILLMLLSSTGPVDRSQACAWPEALRILGLDKADDPDGLSGSSKAEIKALLQAHKDSRAGIAAAILHWLSTPIGVAQPKVEVGQPSAVPIDDPVVGQQHAKHANLRAHPFRAGPACG